MTLWEVKLTDKVCNIMNYSPNNPTLMFNWCINCFKCKLHLQFVSLLFFLKATVNIFILKMVLYIVLIQILHFWFHIKDFIHICAVRRFTAQLEISNPQIIFIIHMWVLWQVKSINYQTIHNLSHIDPNCLINQELKNV